jgi:hypothetical protein
MSSMKVTNLCVALVLSVCGLIGCNTSPEPSGDSVGEVSQDLMQCGPGGECGTGWVCRAVDGACHPACTFLDVSVAEGDVQLGAGAAASGGCPVPFQSWTCCGSYCAVSCP